MRVAALAGKLGSMKSLIRPQHRRRFPVHSMLTLLVFAAPVSAPQAEPAVNESITALLDFYAGLAQYPTPRLSTGDIAELVAGDAVVKMSGQAAPDDAETVVSMGVYGLKIVDAPRLLLWLAVMGGNDERDYRLTTAMLGRGSAGSYTRYQHINLPWPVRDRHWVIHCEKSPHVAVASDGRIWEHRWSLAESGYEQLENALRQQQIAGMSLADASKSIYLPENSGAWTMMDLGAQRTLVIAYVNADLGGRFPDPVVRRFTISKLQAGLRSLRDFSGRVHLNYEEERPIHDGFGNFISRRQALKAAANWPGAQPTTAAD